MKNKTGIILAAFFVFILIGFTGVGFAQQLPCSPACQDNMDCDGDGVNAIECGGGDCDDTDPNTYLAADEICDGLDNDCDGYIPNNEKDSDNDGVIICKGDCDDTDPNTYLAADEICDGLDNDCDGYIPNNERDLDNDNVMTCEGDCNDNNPAINPNASEICDGIDNNCDGNIDEVGTNTCTNYNNCTNYTTCSACPTAPPESCNNADDNCNGQTDETFPELGTTCGIGACSGTLICSADGTATQCNGPSPTAEVCTDSIDNDCDGTTDCSDTDCTNNPVCGTQTCTQKGETCEESEDCCKDNQDLKCKIQEDTKRIEDQEPQKICCGKDECSTTAGCIAQNDCITTNHEKVCAHGTWIPTTKSEQNCNDGIDNDCDAKIDCYDEDCKNRPICGTCATDDDCKENEMCKNTKCTRTQCEKGEQVDNHKCKKLECYKKNDCETEELCSNHKCIDRPNDQKESKKYIKENAERLMHEAAEDIVSKKFQKKDPEKIISQIRKLRDAKVAYFNDEYEKSEAFATEIITGNEEAEQAKGLKGFLYKLKSFFVR